MSYEQDTRRPVDASAGAETGRIQPIVVPPGGGHRVRATPTSHRVDRPATESSPAIQPVVLAQAPVARPRGIHWAAWAGITLVLCILSLFVGIGLGKGTWGFIAGSPMPVSGAAASTSPTPTDEPDTPGDVDVNGDNATSTPPPPPPTSNIRDGEYQVGQSMSVGTWKTEGAAKTECRWSAMDGKDLPVALGVALPGEPQIVILGSRVDTFTTKGCAPWGQD